MLLRYDPFRELDRFERTFGWARRAPAAPMDAVRREDRVELFFDLPGISAESIDLTVERNVLTVKAERHWSPGEDDVLARERAHGSFTRQVRLGDGLDGGAVEADYHDGVLRVSVPLAEQAKPHKVEIQGREEPLAVNSAS